MSDAAKLELEVDVPGFTKQMDDITKVGDAALGKIGTGRGGVLSSFFTRVKQQFQSLSKDTKTLNDEMLRSVKIDEDKLKVAQEVIKAHRDAWTLKKAQQIAEAGGPGTGKIGPHGGVRRDGNGFGQAAGTGAAILNSVVQYAASGGSAQGQLGLAQTGIDLGLSALNAHPGWKQLTDVVTGIAMQGLNAHDKLMESGLRMYQVGGTKYSQDMMGAPHPFFTQEQWANMNVQFARRGGAPTWSMMDDIGWAETAFGLGSQTSNLLASQRRMGVGGSNESGFSQDMHSMRAIGAAVGLGVQSGLDRARFGEVMDQLARSVESQRFVTSDVLGIANRMLFISQMGQQYKGDTAASRQMEGTIQSIAGGGQAFTQLAALRSAGLGSGASYAEAAMRVASGLSETSEGLMTPDVLRENLEPFRAAWTSATEAGRAQLALQYSQLAGINQRDAYRIMDAYFKGPMPTVSAEGGMAHFRGQTIARPLLEPRMHAAAGEKFMFGIGDYVKRALKGASVVATGQGPNLSDVDNTLRNATGSLDAMDPSFEATGARKTGAWTDFRRDSRNQNIMEQYASGGTSRYGDQRAGGVTHKGIDLYFPPGTPVYAPEDGTIEKAGPFTTSGKPWVPANGYMVVLKARVGGLVYKIMHLEPSTVSVRPGQEVTKGELLGTTKKKDWDKTKSHAHVETMMPDSSGNMQHVDPASAMDLESLINPTVDAAGPVTSPEMSTPAVTAEGGGAATVNIKIEDRTSGGVNVKQAVEGYKARANVSAPGEAVATDKGNGI